MKTLKYWSVNHFDVATYKWKLCERVNKQFNGSGSDNTGKCTYTYNELGFRGDSLQKKGFKIMSIGDSHTEGVGVNDDETWSHQFCKLIPNSVDLNFGFGGRSNDYILRCFHTFIDIINPDLLLIMYTYPSRKEFYNFDGDLEPFHINPWGYFLEDEIGKIEHEGLLKVTNKYNDFINWYKNHLIIKYYCESKNIPFIWNGSFLNDKSIEEPNRYDGDYHKFKDKSVHLTHAGPKHNKQYAKKLYNFINRKYPSYLKLN